MDIAEVDACGVANMAILKMRMLTYTQTHKMEHSDHTADRLQVQLQTLL